MPSPACYPVLRHSHPFQLRTKCMFPCLLPQATPEQSAAVSAYVEAASRKSDLERTELQKEKTGVNTGGGGAWG